MEFQLKVRFLTKQGAPMKHTKQYTKDYFQQSGKFVLKSSVQYLLSANKNKHIKYPFTDTNGAGFMQW